MPRFAANLSFLFQDLPFEKRFAAASRAGFKAVEYMFPYDYPIDMLQGLLKDNNLEQVLCNMYPGDWEKGERGLAVLRDREDDFKKAVDLAIRYASALGIPKVNCMAGINVENAEAVRPFLIKRLRHAAKAFADHGLIVVIEPINPIDMPGFFLNYTRQSLDLIEIVGEPNLKVQYDIYHAQRMEGELISTMRNNLDKIGHIQLADVPGRHQPGTGEINYPNVFKAIDEMGYKGWIGLEYKPLSDTLGSFSWISAYGYSL